MYRYLILLLALLGLNVKAQDPEIYKTLPRFPKKAVVHRDNTGPLPGSKATDKAKASVFTISEKHPPALHLLVRVPCSEKITRTELIERAEAAARTKEKATVLTLGKINEGERVAIWLVASTRHWQRIVDVSPKKGEYVLTNNRVTEDLDWHVRRLSIPGADSRCVSESRITRNQLWNMIYNVLEDIQRQSGLSQG